VREPLPGPLSHPGDRQQRESNSPRAPGSISRLTLSDRSATSGTAPDVATRQRISVAPADGNAHPQPAAANAHNFASFASAASIWGEDRVGRARPSRPPPRCRPSPAPVREPLASRRLRIRAAQSPATRPTACTKTKRASAASPRNEPALTTSERTWERPVFSSPSTTYKVHTNFTVADGGDCDSGANGARTRTNTGADQWHQAIVSYTNTPTITTR